MQTFVEWKASKKSQTKTPVSLYDQAPFMITGSSGMQSFSEWKSMKTLTTNKANLQPRYTIDDAKRAIAGIESSGGNYKAVGPPANEKGNRAYGKYQVMDFNIPSWTKEILGKTLTPQQFLEDTQAQEKVFEAKFNQYALQYGGLENAAKVWFGGPGALTNPNAKDVLGTSVRGYAKSFMNWLGETAPAKVVKAQIGGFVQGFQETPIAPKTTDFVEGIGGGFAEAARHAFQQGIDSLNEQERIILDKHSSLLQKGVAVGQGTVDTLETIFGVLLSPLQGFATVPGVGYFVDGINKVFGAIAGGSGSGAVSALDQLPIKDSTKDTLRPLVYDSFALAGQLVAGKLGHSAVKRLSDNSKTILRELSKDPAIIEAIKKEAQAAKSGGVMSFSEWKAAGKPKLSHQEYAKSQGYEPYIPSEQLPVIEMGTRQRSSLPTIQIGETASVRTPRGEVRYVPEPAVTPKQLPATPRSGISPIQVQDVVSRTSESLFPVKTEETTQLQSRVFERLKAENPLLEGDLGYDPITLKKDSAKAVELIEKDRQRAFEVAMGKEASPDITSTAVNIAMAEKALTDGNLPLYTRLVKNRSLAQTRRGQEIVAEKGSVTDNSVSRYVKELVAARLDVLGKGFFDDIRQTVKATSKKERATKAIDKEVNKAETQIRERKLSIKDARALLDALACV